MPSANAGTNHLRGQYLESKIFLAEQPYSSLYNYSLIVLILTSSFYYHSHSTLRKLHPVTYSENSKFEELQDICRAKSYNMSTTLVTNPPSQNESKTARKKKTKTESVANISQDNISSEANKENDPAHVNGTDRPGDSPYLRELSKYGRYFLR